MELKLIEKGCSCRASERRPLYQMVNGVGAILKDGSAFFPFRQFSKPDGTPVGLGESVYEYCSRCNSISSLQVSESFTEIRIRLGKTTRERVESILKAA
jgi:hypothetical protein